MRRISPKRRARLAAAAPIRQSLIERVARCEFCGRRDNGLCVHEILRGHGLRDKAQDKPFAVLVVCNTCHDLMGGRAWEEQLAILRRSRPEDFDLTAFHSLANRRHPDLCEVERWTERYAFVTNQGEL